MCMIIHSIWFITLFYGHEPAKSTINIFFTLIQIDLLLFPLKVGYKSFLSRSINALPHPFGEFLTLCFDKSDVIRAKIMSFF